MFKLLKSEFNYYKLSSIIVFGLIILVNILLTVTDKWVKILLIDKSNIITWGVFVIYYLLFVTSRLQIARINKKTRLGLQKILPLSNYQISCTRVSYFLFLWIILLVILWFFYTLNTHRLYDGEWLKITGFMSVIYLLYSDNIILADDLTVLTFSVKKKFYNLYSQFSVYLVVIFLNYVLVAKINFDFSNWSVLIKQIIRNYFLTEKGIELNLIIGLVLMITTIFTFNKRKSFI